jgi:hypothetical protein
MHHTFGGLLQERDLATSPDEAMMRRQRIERLRCIRLIRQSVLEPVLLADG